MCVDRFVQAKADIIATCTYQVTAEKLMEQYGVSHEKAEDIIVSGVTLAKKAIGKCRSISERQRLLHRRGLDEENASCCVAASIGPYGAMLGDGSEFNGWYTDGMTIEVSRPLQFRRPLLSNCLAIQRLASRSSCLVNSCRT